MGQRVILHIDFDSFFASVEQHFNPELRGKPIGVTAAHSRSCIIAASREAKLYGVKTGSRSFEAYQKCPQLQLVPAHFVRYLDISKKFLSIAKDFSPYVELFSIDEVFIDITKTVSLFGSKERIISSIKQRIKEEIGECITVSVGISHNRLLSKLASGWNKPDGVFEITEKNLDEVYKIANLNDICGIGSRIKLRLNKIGIYTLLQLRDTLLSVLIAEFGPAEADFLHNVGSGIDTSSVVPYTKSPQIKSVGRNYCLPHNEYDMRKVFQNVYELCEEVGIKLRRLNKRARTVGFCLRGSLSVQGRKTFDIYFDTGKEIFDACMRVGPFRGSDPFNQGYIRQISVWAANLSENSSSQLSLFSNTLKNEKLTKTIDNLNEKFGDHTIRNGFLLYADKLTTVPNGYMADKLERTKLSEGVL